MSEQITLRLEVSYWDEDGVGCFEPHKVLRVLQEWFPEVQVEPVDHQSAQLERELAFWEASVADEQQRIGLIRSSRFNNATNGPTYRFTIPVAEGVAVQGWARRLTVGVTFPAETPAELQDRLRQFLRSLSLGQPRFSESPDQAD